MHNAPIGWRLFVLFTITPLSGDIQMSDCDVIVPTMSRLYRLVGQYVPDWYNIRRDMRRALDKCTYEDAAPIIDEVVFNWALFSEGRMRGDTFDWSCNRAIRLLREKGA